MTARVLYVDPHGRSREALNLLRCDGVECVELRDDLKDMIEYMLAGDNLFLVSADELVKMPTHSEPKRALVRILNMIWFCEHINSRT